MPGKVDSVYFLAAFHDFYNHFLGFFNNEQVPTSYFPEKSLFQFGSYPWGLGIFYMPFIFFKIDPYFSFFIIYSLILASNSFGVYLLSRSFKLPIEVSFANGLIFSFSNFVVANFDNPDALVFFPGLLAFATIGKDYRKLYSTMFFLGCQVYFSAYNFLFCSLFILFYLIAIVPWKSIGRKFFFKILSASFIFLIVIIPFISIYFLNSLDANYYNPSTNIENQFFIGLKFMDFLKPLNTNLFFSCFKIEESQNWLYKTKSVYSGFLLLIGVAVSFSLVKFPFKIFWFFIGLFFIVLSFGPFLPIEIPVKGPFFEFYNLLPIHNFFRIPVRSFFVVLLVFIIVNGFLLAEFLKFSKGLFCLFVLLIFLENFSPVLPVYDSKANLRLEMPDSFFTKKDVILNLPTNLYPIYTSAFFDSTCEMNDPEYSIIREYWYIYFQTKWRLNSINGFSSFIPFTRIENQNLIDKICKPGILEEIISRNRITKFVIHKKMDNGCNLDSLKFYFQNNYFIKEMYQDDCIVIYSVVK